MFYIQITILCIFLHTLIMLYALKNEGHMYQVFLHIFVIILQLVSNYLYFNF